VLEPITNWLLRWSQPLAGIGSLLLTGSLVYLYYQQKNLLVASFRANHRAVVEADTILPTEEGLILDLSNVGNGVATDLQLIAIGVYTSNTEEVRDGLVENHLYREDKGEPYSSGSIEAGESEVPYRGRLAIPSYPGGNMMFESAIDELARNDVEVVRIYTFVQYHDLTGNHRIEYLGGWEFEPEEDVEEVSEAFDRGGKLLPMSKPDVDAKTLDYSLEDAETGKERTVI
jgi:hypothetical protein